MTPEALAARLAGARPHAVLDLRERAAYERGHIFRTTSLPRRRLEWELAALVPARGTPLVLVDEDGLLAARAAGRARELGWAAVEILSGGLAAWRARGLALVQGLNVPSKVFGEQVLHAGEVAVLSPAELVALRARTTDVLVLDARTRGEYERGCVPGAIGVPGGELVRRIVDLAPEPSTTLVIHCGGRTRSYIGAASLGRAGLANPVFALDNGTMGWELAGFALERGAARAAPEPSPRARAFARAVAERVAVEDGVACVSPAEAARLVAAPEVAEQTVEDGAGVSLLDVRTPEEFRAGRVPGARSAPGGQLVQATDDYVAVRAATLVLVCDDGSRATLTASWLRRMGYPDVRVLAGGLDAWRDAGRPVETGAPTELPLGLDAARARIPAIVPAALARALGGPAALSVLDVGPSDAYARGHVPGAVWVCRGRLEDIVGALVPDRAALVAVVSPDGIDAIFGAAALADHGYARVRALAGGTGAWTAAGHPLETGSVRYADTPDDVVAKPYDRGRAAMVAYLAWEAALDDEGRSPVALLPGGAGGRT